MRFTNPITSKLKNVAFLLLVAATGLTACKSSMEEDIEEQGVTQDETVTNETIVPASDSNETAEKGSYHLKGYTLKGAFSFPIGVAVVKERLANELYSGTVKREFSRLGSESNFKFKSLHPTENTYTFEKADAIVAFAQANNMKVHGHTLLWANDGTMPKWIVEHKGGAAEYDKLLKDHITTVLRHFKGKVQSWDVVNEAITSGGVYRDNVWLRKLGEGYLLKAFQYAVQADPSVKFFINDFGQEFGGKKMAKYMQIIDDAKKKGIRIDGMGFQMHTVLRIETKKITDNLARAAAKGLLIHISELDVALKYGMPDRFPLTDALARAQGAKVKEIVKGYMTAVPKNLQFGITTWGVGDKDSYFNKGYANFDHDYPLLFDKDYKAKWAYRGFIEAGLGR
jgi:endo-1,4-beta-xylanase